jgi:hypothetical protein
MIDKIQVLTIMQDTVNSLVETSIITDKFTIRENTILYGSSSSLDSIGFVTFVSDLEERINAFSGKDYTIVLLDVNGFDESSDLTAGLLSDYLISLMRS